MSQEDLTIGGAPDKGETQLLAVDKQRGTSEQIPIGQTNSMAREPSIPKGMPADRSYDHRQQTRVSAGIISNS